MAPSGLLIPIVVVALEIFLAHSYWSAFAGLMRVRVALDSAKEDRTELAASAAWRPDADTYQEPQDLEA